MPHVHIKLRTDKVRDGKHPIILQVYFNKKQKQVFTGLWVEPNQFKNGEIIKHPNKSLYNGIISKKKHELEAMFLSGETPESKTASRKSFYDFGVKFFRGKANTADHEYIVRMIYRLNDFKEFAGDVTFQAITPQLLKEYEDHLFAKGISGNTINGRFKKIKEVFTQAIKEKITDNNPFDFYKVIPYKQPQRSFLTLDEIKQIEEADIDPRLHKVRDFFLFACYTGLRYSDSNKISTVKNKGVERLIIATQKTDEQVSIKVTPTIKKLINQLKGKKLPSNQKTNEWLKLIGKAAKITKNLTFHVARHSFAVNAASAGIPIEVTARLLGHNSIRTTAIYYKITDSKLDEAMDKLEEFKQ